MQEKIEIDIKEGVEKTRHMLWFQTTLKVRDNKTRRLCFQASGSIALKKTWKNMEKTKGAGSTTAYLYNSLNILNICGDIHILNDY